MSTLPIACTFRAPGFHCKFNNGISVLTYKNSSPTIVQKSRKPSSSVRASGCFNNPIEEQPIFREALKEPVAFLGGMFAGLLRLDLNDDPLNDWLRRTVEASGIKEELNADKLNAEDEETPQQIVIE